MMMNQTNITATQKTTMIFSIMLAIASIEHGIFEIFQGFKKTSGYIFQAIGEDIRWWEGGTEEAFSLIRNYALSGIIVILIGIFVVIWMLKYSSNSMTPEVFLLSFIFITLLGGGLGHIPFFLIVYMYSRRNWKKSMDKTKEKDNVWIIPTVIAALFWLIAIEIAIFGYFPYITETEDLYVVCWSSLGVTFIFINVSYILTNIRNKKRLTIAST